MNPGTKNKQNRSAEIGNRVVRSSPRTSELGIVMLIIKKVPERSHPTGMNGGNFVCR